MRQAGAIPSWIMHRNEEPWENTGPRGAGGMNRLPWQSLRHTRPRLWHRDSLGGFQQHTLLQQVAQRRPGRGPHLQVPNPAAVG